MTIDELALVLHQVWGCHGTAAIVDDVFCLKRTSPSGGGLHPVEVYPLVSGVDGVDAGLYHYSARDHSLELIEQLGARTRPSLSPPTSPADSGISAARTSRS